MTPVAQMSFASLFIHLVHWIYKKGSIVESKMSTAQLLRLDLEELVQVELGEPDSIVGAARLKVDHEWRLTVEVFTKNF